MIRHTFVPLSLGLLLAAGCGDDGSPPRSTLEELPDDRVSTGREQAAASATAAADDGDEEGQAAADALPEGLDCPRGGSTAPVSVSFFCGQITVLSCKDLSNVVVELADGSRQRFEGLRGHTNAFVPAGAREQAITKVWVKAGSNHSGEGPGYGQRFDAPDGTCTPPPGDECADIVDGWCAPFEPPTKPPTESECEDGPDSWCRPFEPPTRTPKEPGKPSEPVIAI